MVLAGIDRQTLSTVLIEIGAAIGLVAVLVLLERNVINRVTEAAGAAATVAANRATSDLRERIVRLEILMKSNSTSVTGVGEKLIL